MTLRSALTAAFLLAASPIAADAQTNSGLVTSLERLASGNNAEAIYHLGMMYHTGSGLPINHAKAFAAFARAATLGDPLAAYKLGCYYDGQGEGVVEDDADKALTYKLVAAKAGYALARQDVAALYARIGKMETAVQWIEQAAAQGWEGGLVGLASVYNGAPGVERDPAKAAGYFRLLLARTNASQQQRDWLSDYEKALTPAERARADQIVSEFSPAPTALTMKALSGQRAAIALVSKPR